MGDDRQMRLRIAVASGLLAGAALPPLGLPPLLWIALALLWGLAQPGDLQGAPGSLIGSPPAVPATGGWRACHSSPIAMGGMLWGTPAVLVSHRWLLALHPLDWIGVPGPLSLPICLTLWCGCGLLGGLLVALWLLLMARLGASRLSTALIGAALWGLAEVTLARGPLFWIGLGSATLPGDPPLAGLGSLIGAGGLAAVQLLIGWGLWRLLQGVREIRPGNGSRRRLAPAAALAVTLLLLHLVGAASLAAASEAGPGERLLVLQPAIPTREKFTLLQQLGLRRQLTAALETAARVPGTVLLPEGSLALGESLPEAAPVEVLSGGFRQEGEQQRSSLLRFAPGGLRPVQWVDKHRLVPLGEWVPGAALWRWSGLSAVGGLQAGPPSRLLARPEGAVGVSICYELADGQGLARATRDGALWLLASANLDPYPLMLQHQFAALARLRAIESGRWLVSAANTGPSLLVDATGRVRAQLPPGRPGLGAMEIRSRRVLTPYVLWGEWPLALLLLLGLTFRLSPAIPGVQGSRRLGAIPRRPNITTE